ncbi:50S ribosomal protein L33 [Patescibacteria group bacterium]|nr:50S ribosomal protein L33 [Patescibacteria group bacterium]
MPAKRKPFVKFQCTDCKNINYFLHKSKMLNEQKKLELKKFCRKCRKHTVHKEGKK